MGQKHLLLHECLLSLVLSLALNQRDMISRNLVCWNVVKRCRRYEVGQWGSSWRVCSDRSCRGVKDSKQMQRRKTDHMQCDRQRRHLWIQPHPLQKPRRHCLTALEKTRKTRDWGVCLGFIELVPRFSTTFLFDAVSVSESSDLASAVGGSRAAIARGCRGATVRSEIAWVMFHCVPISSCCFQNEDPTCRRLTRQKHLLLHECLLSLVLSLALGQFYSNTHDMISRNLVCWNVAERCRRYEVGQWGSSWRVCSDCSCRGASADKRTDRFFDILFNSICMFNFCRIWCLIIVGHENVIYHLYRIRRGYL